MIAENEMRLGNWVYLAWEPFRFTAEAFNYRKELLDPIPLTEEILLKVGFKQSDEDSFSFEIDGAEYAFEKQDDWWFIGIKQPGTINYFAWHIYNVHQLQNLYWCLCGTELTINL